ncbi:class I SAM-dependent methyltransferase [Ilyomonas limi]|uniref:Class I SAM-dependent methyltransferase n=1 Tax=Ilyomonas limi TaxID=2575867 RepID=A0A4U3L1B4_9BACT|nr:class I SAM-dependent methyltransferase [Ilyomonas limi]TKK68921.1 class I SAM-dependent methyltransferase [Ilyomonas limi]
MRCRFCSKTIHNIFIDLGSTAVSNAFLTKENLNDRECLYPLKVLVCDNCFLVQVDEYQKREEIFSPDYVYFSSVSEYWLAHSKKYVEKITPRFNLNTNSLVVEIASNDGYLLQYFQEKNIPVLGIEPTASTAQIAINKGIDTIIEFFDENLALKLSELRKADLILGNNVLAHVPDLNSFVRGLKILLKPVGVMTFEFPHLMKLIEKTEFDTIYHEHFSYFSFYFINKLFDFHGFKIFDVEQLETHGGSLRIYVKHRENENEPVLESVQQLLDTELTAGVNKISSYKGFNERANNAKYKFLSYIIGERMKGKKIIAFGAAAKGNTFLNYCGIKPDIIECVVDDTPSKQGKFLPQSHIPVVSRDYFVDNKPDIIIILPWNFKKEIIEKLAFTKSWGTQLVTYIPDIEIN